MPLPDPRERPWLSVAEVAQITGEGEKVIRAALDAGQLPQLRIGRYVRVPTYLLLQQLGMPTPETSEAGTPMPATATTNQDPGGPGSAHDAPGPRRIA